MLMAEDGKLPNWKGIIYKPYPASLVGMEDVVEINRNSGRSTVTLKLRRLQQQLDGVEDIDPNCPDSVKDAILAYAGQNSGNLSDEEILNIYISRMLRFKLDKLNAEHKSAEHNSD
jgi:hypothetical protein